MITEIVLLDLPKGMSREQVIANYRESSLRWRENPDLIRKSYIYDAANGQGGGVYLWKDIAAAKRWHGDDFRKRMVGRYGSEPVIRYYETAIVVDNDAQKIVEDIAA